MQPGTGDQDIGLVKENDIFGNVFDYGTGGMALCPARRNSTSNSQVDIYVGVQAFYAANSNHAGPQSATMLADDIVSAIAVVQFQGASSFGSSALQETQKLVLDGYSANTPKVYGVCGIEVGEIVPGNNKQEIVVTSLDGRLLLYEREADGTRGPRPGWKSHAEGLAAATNGEDC